MHDFFLVIHLIGLTMALGTGFANMFLGSVAAKMEPAERGNFMGKLMVLTRMGQIGLGLLLISGFYLITPYWKVLSEMPTLIAKLVTIGSLIIMVTITSLTAKKAVQTKDPTLFAKLKPMGMVIFVLGITTVVLAVMTFH